MQNQPTQGGHVDMDTGDKEDTLFARTMSEQVAHFRRTDQWGQTRGSQLTFTSLGGPSPHQVGGACIGRRTTHIGGDMTMHIYKGARYTLSEDYLW